MGIPITGRERVFAFLKTALWGTAEAVGAGDGAALSDDSLSTSRTVEKLRDESVGLGPFVQNSHLGLENLSGSLAGNMRYQGVFELMLAMVAGSPGIKVGAGPYTNTIKVQGNNDGIFGTYATERTSATIIELPSVKVNGLSLSADMGGIVQADFKCIANLLVKTGDAGVVNTYADLAAATMHTDVLENLVVFDRNSEFLINGSAAGALAPTTIDEIGIGNFAFDFDRGGDQVHKSGVHGIVESKEDAFPNPTFNFNMIEYTDDGAITTVTSSDFEDAFGTVDTFKARLKLYKDANFQLFLYLPKLSVTAVNPSPTEVGRTVTTVECECLRASANPAGMDDVGPFYFVLINQNAAVIWA